MVMRVLVTVVCMAWLVSATNVRHMLYTMSENEEIFCSGTKSGFEQEIKLKNGGGDEVYPDTDKVMSVCGYKYNDRFGYVKLGATNILEVKADDHCKLELATMPVQNLNGGKAQLVAATYATMAFVACGDTTTVKDCLDGFTASVKGTYPDMSFQKDEQLTDAAAFKRLNVFATHKFKSAGAFQFNVGLPLQAWDPSWPEKAKQLIDPTTSAFPLLFKLGDAKWSYNARGRSSKCQDPKLKGKSTETQWCVLKETLNYMSSKAEAEAKRLNKKTLVNKEVNQILPKIKWPDANYGGSPDPLVAKMEAALKATGVSTSLTVGEILTGHPISMFECEGHPGVVCEVRYSDIHFVDPGLRMAKAAFEAKKAPSKDEVLKVVNTLLQAQENIWLEQNAELNKPKAPQVVHPSFNKNGKMYKWVEPSEYELVTSGGGNRAAVGTVLSLMHLACQLKDMNRINALSGGSWGTTYFAVNGDKAPREFHVDAKHMGFFQKLLSSDVFYTEWLDAIREQTNLHPNATVTEAHELTKKLLVSMVRACDSSSFTYKKFDEAHVSAAYKTAKKIPQAEGDKLVDQDSLVSWYTKLWFMGNSHQISKDDQLFKWCVRPKTGQVKPEEWLHMKHLGIPFSISFLGLFPDPTKGAPSNGYHDHCGAWCKVDLGAVTTARETNGVGECILNEPTDDNSRKFEVHELTGIDHLLRLSSSAPSTHATPGLARKQPVLLDCKKDTCTSDAGCKKIQVKAGVDPGASINIDLITTINGLSKTIVVTDFSDVSPADKMYNFVRYNVYCRAKPSKKEAAGQVCDQVRVTKVFCYDKTKPKYNRIIPCPNGQKDIAKSVFVHLESLQKRKKILYIPFYGHNDGENLIKNYGTLIQVGPIPTAIRPMDQTLMGKLLQELSPVYTELAPILEYELKDLRNPWEGITIKPDGTIQVGGSSSGKATTGKATTGKATTGKATTGKATTSGKSGKTGGGKSLSPTKRPK